jgi:hypothetical protein
MLIYNDQQIVGCLGCILRVVRNRLVFVLRMYSFRANCQKWDAVDFNFVDDFLIER